MTTPKAPVTNASTTEAPITTARSTTPVLPKACGTNGPILVDYGYTLTSPNFPNAYDSSALCSWEFVSPPDTLLEIHFKHFEVSFAKELGFL